ncbi:hypothetical protein FHL15_006964 [Xylaria flabelliformis]|uniref:Uncharacterized protein n=1 Tax=Xylaria flabelliformis TaxID=2512241 RepID=A0A553HVY9_9PEZI|nr:hypothetical protein FHL15_006964 [Xylaria flabelliformis]
MSSSMEKNSAELDAIKKTWEDEQERFVTEIRNGFHLLTLLEQHHLARKKQLLSRELEIKEAMAQETLPRTLNSVEQRNEVHLPAFYCWSKSQAKVSVWIDEAPQGFIDPDVSSFYYPTIFGNSHAQASTTSAPPADTGAAPVPSRGSSPIRDTIICAPISENSIPKGFRGMLLQEGSRTSRKTPLRPILHHIKFTKKPNIDFKEVERRNLWVFECRVWFKVRYQWCYLTMKCPVHSVCPVFSKNPMWGNRAANHLRECGVPFEDEYDMLCNYARIA